MSFLDFLKEKGDALKDFADKEDKEEKSSVEKLIDFQKAKDEFKLDDEKEKLAETEDTDETTSIEQILAKESADKEEKGKEKDLEEKLADIEKVISTFSEQTPLSKTDTQSFKDTLDLNKALDLRKDITKDIVRPFVKLPSVNQDRIELLIETLKKQNLL
jgi:hypothetical protein